MVIHMKNLKINSRILQLGNQPKGFEDGCCCYYYRTCSLITFVLGSVINLNIVIVCFTACIVA